MCDCIRKTWKNLEKLGKIGKIWENVPKK